MFRIPAPYEFSVITGELYGDVLEGESRGTVEIYIHTDGTLLHIWSGEKNFLLLLRGKAFLYPAEEMVKLLSGVPVEPRVLDPMDLERVLLEELEGSPPWDDSDDPEG